MKHRRHGRHAAKSTGNCLSMLAAAVAFGLLNMGSASAAPVTPDKAALDANRDRLVNAGQLVEEQRNKKDFDPAMLHPSSTARSRATGMSMSSTRTVCCSARTPALTSAHSSLRRRGSATAT